MSDRIFYPEVINSYALPETVAEDSHATKGSVVGTIVQEGIANTPFPISETVREVISKSLNTQSKKILGNYTFGVHGAMAIGTYESGVSGDIKISPDGIVGRNNAGETTFSIDGTTGSATFKGTLLAGVVVAAGALVVGTNVDIGTAEDSAGVTTIIGNVVTTGYVDALNVTAKYVVASISISSPSISGGAITGGTIIGTTIKTRASGVRVELNADEATIKFFDSGNDQVFLIDEASYGAVPVVRVASYDNRGIWLDSDDDIYITADVDLYLGVGTGSIVIADDTYMGGNLDMNNHNISEIATATMTNCHATVGIFNNAIQVDDIYDNGQGHIEIHDGVYISDDMTVTSWVWIGGSLTVDGTKDFLIPHPDKSNRLLKYSCIEAPEVAVSYRGILELTTEVEFIPVPKHFELVTEPRGLITVQITPIGENTVHVIDTPTNAGFNVKGIPGTKVMFEITAIRKGFLNNEVEIDLGKNTKSPFGKQHLKRMRMRKISAEKKSSQQGQNSIL